jgi:pilus assembly protein CpaB
MSLRPAGSGTLAGVVTQQQASDSKVPVVVAQIDLPKGTLLNTPDQLLSLSEIPASQFNDQAQFNDLETLRDMVTTIDIQAGEPLRQNVVRKAGLAQKIPAPSDGQPSLKAFPIQVNSLSGVADLIAPGDFVDVLASFGVDVLTLYPDGDGGLQEKTSTEGTTKALLQDIEVVDVIKPSFPAEDQQAEPTPDLSPQNGEVQPENSSTANTLKPGNWIIILAVTDEEAEILRYTLNHGINLTTILRRAGDHTTERTVGVTLQILVETYGLPKPSLLRIDRVEQAPPKPTSSPKP